MRVAGGIGKNCGLEGQTLAYNLENEAVRQWWLDSVANLVTRGSLDGVFLDAIPKIPEAQIPIFIEMLQELRRRIGDDKLILYNGFRVMQPDKILGGPEVLEETSGVFVEAFFSKPVTTKERGAALLEAMSKAAEERKTIIARGSPERCWGTTRQDPTFALAAFLIAAGPESYFCYNWGYNIDEGALADFEILRKGVGAPRGKPKRKGWVFTREFEHARVRVNLEKAEAEIQSK